MVRNAYAKIYASTIAPDPALDVLWMDLSEDPKGSIIKFWDGEYYLPISLGNAGELDNVLASIAAEIAQAKSEAISESGVYTDSKIAMINLDGYMTIEADNSNVGVLRFNQNPPSGSLFAGEMKWDSAEGTMGMGMNGGGVIQSIGLELFYRVNNKTQVDIINGDLVAFDGSDGNSGRINVKKAVPGVNPNHILGVATENIFQGETGFVTWFGKIRGIQTDGADVSEVWTSGTTLYPHPSISGKLTKNEPLTGNKLPIAAVISAHGVNGTMFVRVQRSVNIQDINDIDVSTAVAGQPLVKQSDGKWRNSNAIKVSQIDPLGSTVNIPANVSTNSLSTTSVIANEVTSSTSITAPGYKIPTKTNNDIVMANGGTLPITTLKTGIYRLYNPANNTQVVLEINTAGQVLVNGDMIVNGTAYKIDAEEILTKEQYITLRSDSIYGMPAGNLSGLIIKKYDGVNDGMIVIDKEGVLRIGDAGDLQPVMTREELPFNNGYLYYNSTSNRAESLYAGHIKSPLSENDVIPISDSNTSYTPKNVKYSDLESQLKSSIGSEFIFYISHDDISVRVGIGEQVFVEESTTGYPSVILNLSTI